MWYIFEQLLPRDRLRAGSQRKAHTFQVPCEGALVTCLFPIHLTITLTLTYPGSLDRPALKSCLRVFLGVVRKILSILQFFDKKYYKKNLFFMFQLNRIIYGATLSEFIDESGNTATSQCTAVDSLPCSVGGKSIETKYFT